MTFLGYFRVTARLFGFARHLFHNIILVSLFSTIKAEALLKRPEENLLRRRRKILCFFVFQRKIQKNTRNAMRAGFVIQKSDKSVFNFKYRTVFHQHSKQIAIYDISQLQERQSAF